MTTGLNNQTTYSRFNLSESLSDINIFVNLYRERILKQLSAKENDYKSPFVSFAQKRLTISDIEWLEDNHDRFFANTPNEELLKLDYLSQLGYICCMLYSPDGDHLIVGHSSGLIQVLMDEEKNILDEFADSVRDYYENENSRKIWYPMFSNINYCKRQEHLPWIKENNEKFMRGSQNEILYNRWFFSEMGAITALEYSPNGSHIIVGHSSGLIQMRHGNSGIVLATLRNIQFPPKPVYALHYSLKEARVCYAACMDGAIYRIEIPNICAATETNQQFCIKADPALEYLSMQFFGTPGISSYSTPFITQRSPALSLGLTADESRVVVGYADSSIKVYDKETQEAESTYKVHKLRLQFVPKKLQRMHFGQVCAVRCHSQKPYMFASGAWDKTLRIWDVRCPIGCVMTFEGVDICTDSIDLNRDRCIAGSWQTTEALSEWDLSAKKRLNIIIVQNRRPDIDGEYIYACRYWNSKQYNRKGKYAIIGGSGTKCVEVINLHNRYISCSYPCDGTVLAITSYEERIAFGGTAPVLNIVSFHDPKHEKYHSDKDSDIQFGMEIENVYLYDNNNGTESTVYDAEEPHTCPEQM